MQFYCHKMCVGVGGLEFRKKCLYNTTLFPSSLVPRQSHPGIRALLVWHCICQQSVAGDITNCKCLMRVGYVHHLQTEHLHALVDLKDFQTYI